MIDLPKIFPALQTERLILGKQDYEIRAFPKISHPCLTPIFWKMQKGG
jgi:hypothetical protein